MVDFRRCITALAMLALFAGLAAAQINNGGGQLNCVANTSSLPALRAEGLSETTGDVTLTCTGGNVITPGTAVPLVNITVFYTAAVSSRLFSTNPNLSEALLLIDEPGSGLFVPANPATVPPTPAQSPGAALPQLLCTTPTTGCQAIAGAGSTLLAPGGGQGANVYQGITNGNSVTFFGVPVLPPTTTGSRVFRITNVRVVANNVSPGTTGGAQVQASFQISPATSLLITQATVAVGVVSTSLSTGTSSSTPTNFQQCTSATRSATNTITFTENFGTAFKTRIVAQDNTQFAGQGIAKVFLGPGNAGNSLGATATTSGVLGINQNTPGAFYNSESNFVFPVPGGTAGLADFGTRLKATFNNIPANTTLFVSVNNVQNSALVAGVPPCGLGVTTANPTGCTAANPPGGNGGNTSTTGFAQLVSSETVNDGNAVGGFFPSIAGTDNAAGPVSIVAVPIVNGTGTAVWEVLNTNPNALETFRFGVYFTFVASTATNSPASGTSSVNLSYAPTFTSAGGASTSVPIPRFVPDSGTAKNLFSVNICRTVLLYPYVTNQQGFDTGITVANTSNDAPVFSTGAQSGKCTFNFYGGTTLAPNTPPPAFTTPNTIVAGTVFADGLSDPAFAPGFQGYIIAVCNFQFAHGFAFINNPSQINNVAMGYLALVIPDAGTGSRLAGPDCNGIAGCPSNGESAAH